MFHWITKYRLQISLLSLFVCLIGLFYSKAMLSIGMILLGVLSVFNSDWKNTLKQVWLKKTYFLFILLYVMLIISGLYSEDMSYYIERIRIKLPFLVFPLAFASMPKWDRKHLDYYLSTFLALLLISTFPLIYEFIIDYESVVELYGKGKVLKTPIPHIRYSLLVAFGIGVSFYLATNEKWLRYKYVFQSLGLFLFIFLHLLAVRSGMVCFYAAVLSWLLFRLIKGGNWKQALISMVFFLLGTGVMLKVIPSLERKVAYTIYMWERIDDASKLAKMSDSKRLLSLQMGKDLWEKSPVIGVGVGDLWGEVNNWYQINYPKMKVEDRVIPHNQYLFFMVSIGVVGLLVWLILLAYPFIFYWQTLHPLYVFFSIIMIVSYLMEATIEGAIGTAILFLFGMPLLMFSEKVKNI